MYKVRASKGATSIASLELMEAREKIELQVNQNTFRVNEANKTLAMAQANIARADENLRTATLGFQEGCYHSRYRDGSPDRLAPGTVAED